MIVRTRTDHVKQKPHTRAEQLLKLEDAFPELFVGADAAQQAESDSWLAGLQSAIEQDPAKVRHLLMTALALPTRRAAK